MKKKIHGTIIIFLCLLATYWFVHHSQENDVEGIQDVQDIYKVTLSEIYNVKPLAVRVDSQHRVFARSRIAGTVVSINVEEGNLVKQGETLLTLVDSKLIHQIQAIEAQIASASDQLNLAQTDLERAQALQKSQSISKSDLDKKETAFKVAQNSLKAFNEQKETLLAQQAEGKVLAPIVGKVVSIPITMGSVMLVGENAVEIAGGDFLLKLSVPESHAAYLKNNDTIQIIDPTQKTREGTIIKIYPKLQNGQILADVKLSNIDDLYVDQLLTACLKTDRRKAIIIPKTYLTEKLGLYFVNLKDAGQVAVEVGKKEGNQAEIVSGLKEGDELCH